MYRPPSGARPSSRMSENFCGLATPRVLTYCTGLLGAFLRLLLFLQLVELAHLVFRRLLVCSFRHAGRRLSRLWFLLAVLRGGAQAEQQRECEHESLHNSSSSRRRTTLPSTVGRRSMRAIARSTLRSSARCVSITMSTRLSPCGGSFCTIASIEIFESARMRVTRASTPGLSCTRMRR